MSLAASLPTARAARRHDHEQTGGIVRDGDAQVKAGRVLVVGAINLDIVVTADHLPRPGETVVGPRAESYGGGKGANAAVAAARAGASVAIVGAIGGDGAGADAERELVDEGVDCTALSRLDNERTGVALIVVDPTGENQIAVGAGANMALSAEWVAARVADAASEVDCVLVSTEIPGEAVLAAIAAAAAENLRCILNPAPPIKAVSDALPHRPILTPNSGELATLFAAITGRETDHGPPSTNAEILDQALVVSAATEAPVVVTLGANGILTVHDGHAVHHAAPIVPVVDATGAGDTFNGVFAAQLATGEPLLNAARFAMSAASLSVSQLGARTGMPRAGSMTAANADASGGPSPQRSV
jgi:ribokinase